MTLDLMKMFRTGQRSRKTRNQYRDEIYESPHVGRYCLICGIITVFEVKEMISFCIKCGRHYNRTGKKLLTQAEIEELSK